MSAEERAAARHDRLLDGLSGAGDAGAAEPVVAGGDG
jgi:hypothetical protein